VFVTSWNNNYGTLNASMEFPSPSDNQSLVGYEKKKINKEKNFQTKTK